MSDSLWKAPSGELAALPADGPRIGVIGAGAAGLSVAAYLQRRGFHRVTVLEAGGDVGGKCHTFTIGDRRHELGAGLLTFAYPHVRELLSAVGLTTRLCNSTAAIDCGAGTVERRPSFIRPTLVARLPMLRLALELWRQRAVRHPGLAGLGPELAEPFRAWAERRGLGRFAAYIEPVVTGFGYGHADAVPAAYYLKYVYLMRLPACEVPAGFQELWRRVAAGLDVRLGEPVVRVRRGDEVVVETRQREHRFDYLIVATPPREASAYLDLGAEERELMGRVRYYAYHAVSVRAAGMPKLARINCLVDRQNRGVSGRPIFLYKRWLDGDDLNFYAMSNEPVGSGPELREADVMAQVEADVRRFGGRITQIHRYQPWTYFPHVGPADFAGDYYGRFDRLQGERRTFYVGELFNFATVEHVCAFSAQVAERAARRIAEDRQRPAEAPARLPTFRQERAS